MMNNDDFFFFFLQARLFDEPQLASLCLDTIDKSTADAVNAEGFTDIDLGKTCISLCMYDQCDPKCHPYSCHIHISVNSSFVHY